MKKTLFSILTLTLLWGCNQEQSTAEKEVEVTTSNTEEGKTYGTAFSDAKRISVAQLQEAVQEQDSLQAVVEGKIASSCQAKGCWMDVKLADNSTMKVTFRDYGFFLPVENLEGKSVVFTGTAKRELISVDDQRHYAKDAGKSESAINSIIEPKEELRFIADGVILN